MNSARPAMPDQTSEDHENRVFWTTFAGAMLITSAALVALNSLLEWVLT